MALFKYQCNTCKKLTRLLLPSRPKLEACECGGKQSFITDTQALVMETRDNGIMPRKVEQIQDVERMVKDRSTDPKDPGIV